VVESTEQEFQQKDKQGRKRGGRRDQKTVSEDKTVSIPEAKRKTINRIIGAAGKPVLFDQQFQFR